MARYVPAAGFRAFTRLYDPVLRVTMREGAWRGPLAAQVLEGRPASVLDLGCGTGTLAIELEARTPGTRIVGVDGDSEVLARARDKAGPASRIEWIEARAQWLPFENASFERVVSSLFFHHLVPSAKRAALLEVHRALAPGGRLHLADFGRPQDPLMRALFRTGVQVLDGMENTRDHAAGRVPELIAAAGFHDVRRGKRVRTALGSMELLTARR